MARLVSLMAQWIVLALKTPMNAEVVMDVQIPMGDMVCHEGGEACVSMVSVAWPRHTVSF